MDNMLTPILGAIGTAAVGLIISVANSLVAQLKTYVEATLIHRAVERGAGLAYMTLLARGQADPDTVANAIATASEYTMRRVGGAIAGRGLTTQDVTEMARAQVGDLLSRDPTVAISSPEALVNIVKNGIGQGLVNIVQPVPVAAVGDQGAPR